MFSELERLLRRGREVLPEPDADSTRRARARALAAVRRSRRPHRVRLAALLGAAVVLAAVGLGVGAGILITPGGTASRAPVSLGFLPAPGWFAYQTGTETSAVFQTIAVASNVPLDPDDVVAGAADPSGLPYSTLLTLPQDGIVVVASFTRPFGVPRSDASYPQATLPLRLRDATAYVAAGTQLRPEDPLGQLQLRATVQGRRVDVVVYFGTPRPSSALRAEAQRQLERLVIRSAASERAPTTHASAHPAAALPGLIDRSFTCAPALVGGVRQIDARARRGSGHSGSGWDRPAFASVSTIVSGASATAIENELVWVAAGAPSADATVVSTSVGFTFPFRSWGTIGVNSRLCRATAVRVSLSGQGLRGGPVGPFDDRWDCAAGRRILVRVRAVLESPSGLKSFRGFLRTTVPVRSATLAVQTQAGKRLAYAQVLQSGESLLFTAPSCLPD